MRTVVVTEQDREALILAIKMMPLDGRHAYVCELRDVEENDPIMEESA